MDQNGGQYFPGSATFDNIVGEAQNAENTPFTTDLLPNHHMNHPSVVSSSRATNNTHVIAKKRGNSTTNANVQHLTGNNSSIISSKMNTKARMSNEKALRRNNQNLAAFSCDTSLENAQAKTRPASKRKQTTSF